MSLAVLLAMLSWAPALHAAPTDSVFIVGNYPVEARANDALTAKEKALAEGQTRAFHSLLKRLVPVTAYGRLKRMTAVKAADLVDGVQVRSERSSPTEYIANLDFTFQAAAVRELLGREGLPYTDEQAPRIVVVPVWQPGAAASLPAALAAGRGDTAWLEAWKGLDLVHALTPARLEPVRKEIVPEIIKAMAGGDLAGLRVLAGEYQSDLVVLAIAEPDTASRRFNVTLTGQDAVGAMTWRRSYRLDLADPGYTVELASVVSLGVLEGRWKAARVRGSAAGAQGTGFGAFAEASNVQFTVEFRGIAEWADISRRLSQTPGVDAVDVAGLSARSARVALRYPGGIERLANVLREQGLTLREAANGWTLSAQ